MPFDLFISYRHAAPDKGWVRGRLAPRLEACGLRVWLDEHALVPGRSLLAQMERGVLESRYTVAVLTPAYLAGRFGMLELALANCRGREEQGSRLLVVLREACRIPITLSADQVFDMIADEAFETTMTRLHETIRSSM